MDTWTTLPTPPRLRRGRRVGSFAASFVAPATAPATASASSPGGGGLRTVGGGRVYAVDVDVGADPEPGHIHSHHRNLNTATIKKATAS